MTLESNAATIWGEPQPEFQEAPYRIHRGPTGYASTLVEQLRFFLQSQLEEWAPDIIIVHERKGTAVLRALIEGVPNPIRWRWKDIVSSTALDQLPADFFLGRRVLIFDDMIRTGKTLVPVYERLRRLHCLSPQTVRLAVFAAHEDSSRNGVFTPNDFSVAWFYRDLAPQGYRRLRTQLLNFLQRSGSLMLDTEHIEVRFTLHAGIGRLLSALRRKAEATVFQSAANRTNITVFYPDDLAHSLPVDKFPDGCAQAGIVKKCRVVQRNADEFAIIPICLPSTPVDDAAWPHTPRDCGLLGGAVQWTHYAKFYGAALIASFYPLQWILRDLYAADPRTVTISLPSRSGSAMTAGGYSLEHLRVMYPTLDTDQLVEMIAETDRAAQSEGAKLRSRHFDIAPYVPALDAQLRMDAMYLLQVIANAVDERHATELLFNPTCDRRLGLKSTEVFELGERLGFQRPYISALFDLLIDDGSIVTRVEEVVDEDGVTRLVRTFKPDGEAVSDLVRHLTVQWGLPSGF
jgi:hypothetical protein